MPTFWKATCRPRSCHLGNISYVWASQPADFDAIEKNLPDFGGAAVQETFERTKAHLDENDVDLDTSVAVGRGLAFDPAREEFIDNTEANKLLTREYREPFVVPTADKL